MSGLKRYRVCSLRFVAGFCFLVGFAASPATAGDDTKSPDPAPKSKWNLPPHYDKLELSDDQKARVTRIAEVCNPKINSLIRTIEEIRKSPGLGRQLIPLSLALTKLRNDRQRLLNEVLTDTQREKLRELSGNK
jgi:hypothetical protein